MSGSQRIVHAGPLREYLTGLFTKAGLSANDALYVAECTVQTNLWGIDSHGLLRTPIYVERLVNGAVNPNPRMTVLSGEEAALELCDGDNGLGFIVSRWAMQRSVRKARRSGIAMTVVRSSNHFGAASLFSKIASDAGMFGISATNVMPNIGMRGNRKPATGNNPIALSAPLGGEFPFMLDISMSSVAGGKLLLAQKKGEKIPTDWAVTKDGLETDDPFEGFNGFLLPMGMHKGFGISLYIDLLTGVLGGGAFLHELKSMYGNPEEPSRTSHLFCAIDPSVFWDKEAFIDRMRAWSRKIASVPMVHSGERQLIPGELEYMREQQRLREGLSIPSKLIAELDELSSKIGYQKNISDMLEQE